VVLGFLRLTILKIYTKGLVEVLKLKIVIGSIQQETNTFSPVKIRYEDFEIARGRDILQKVYSTRFLLDKEIDIIPTLYANAVPSGILDERVFLRLEEELLRNIPEHSGADGVLLHLHGSLEVENIGSGEAHLVSEVRKKVGPRVLISISLDFHANNSSLLIESADIITGYRTAPHVDVERTQIRAARLLWQCLMEDIVPKPVMVKVPLILSGDIAPTTIDPGRSLILELDKVNNNEEILDISLFVGQLWVDAPNTGASIVAVAKKDVSVAIQEAKRIAKMLWKARSDFCFEDEAYEPEIAIEKMVKAKEDKIIITDSGDNPGAGAAGDNTHLLKLLLAKGVENVVIAGITDNKVVDLCDGIRIGERVKATLGGGIDKQSESVKIEGILKARGKIPGWSSGDPDCQSAAAIPSVVIKTRGIDVIVTKNRCIFLTEEHFQAIDINLDDYRIIVIKSGYLSPEFKKISQRSILALTAGASCESIEMLEFRKIKRPVFPIDKNFEFKID